MAAEASRQLQERANATRWRDTLDQALFPLNTILPGNDASKDLAASVENAIRQLAMQARSYSDGFDGGQSSSPRPNFELLRSDAVLADLEAAAARLNRSGELSRADFDGLTRQVLKPLREGIRAWPPSPPPYSP